MSKRRPHKTKSSTNRKRTSNARTLQRVNESKDSAVFVEQDHYEVAIDCEDLYTLGAGPCVVAAFSFEKLAYLFHGANAHMSGDFDAFVNEACQEIPKGRRRDVVVILAGGYTKVKGERQGVRAAREYCRNLLLSHGFTNLDERWCMAPHDGQNISVLPKQNAVEITSTHSADDGDVPEMTQNIKMD